MNPLRKVLAYAAAATAGLSGYDVNDEVETTIRTDRVNWLKVPRLPRSGRRSHSNRKIKQWNKGVARKRRLDKAKIKYERDKRSAMMNPAWIGQKWLERRFPV